MERKKTQETRDYFSGSDLGTKMTAEEIQSIINKCKFGRRVDPMVDIESHGKFNVAANLKKRGILDSASEEQIHSLIKQIKKKIPNKKQFDPLKILFINATEFGGGVAEMRPNNARFMKEFNVDGDWAVIDGCDEFYGATVHIHEGIQNSKYSPLRPEEYEILSLVSVLNFSRFDFLGIFDRYDAIWIDDPQPLGMLPMIKALHPDIPVIWRCHVHAEPEESIRLYLSEILEGRILKDKHSIMWKYMADNHGVDFEIFPRQSLKVNAAVFHLEDFSKGLNLSADIPVHIMGPAIDPLSFKNMMVSQNFILATLSHYGIVRAKKHDEKYQMRLAKKTKLPRVASNVSISSVDSGDSGEDGQWAYNVPPYVLEVSRYDPYKGPFEVVVSFIEAMRGLDPANELLRFVRENCRFVFAASTPGDNPTGAQIKNNLENFLKNCQVLNEPGCRGLYGRIFLLSLKDQRRIEILRKKIFEKTWEHEVHKKELMIEDVLMHHAVSPAKELVENLRKGPNPLISSDMADHLMKESEEFSTANQEAYFTLEQIDSAAESVSKLETCDASVWAKIKNNALSGKEMNHLEVNAFQTGAFVTCQFSSKEGFGLVVSEAMVKHETCSPPVNRVMVATTVGGVKSQVNETVAIPVEYPPEEAAESLLLYQTMRSEDVDNPEAATELYGRIAARKSVQDFAAAIRKAVKMPVAERELRSRSARSFILNNFSIHSNVLNILSVAHSVIERNVAEK